MIGILVELTNFGHGIDAAFAALIGYVAVLLVGAAATWWAHLELKARRKATKPSGLTGLAAPDQDGPAPLARRVDLQPAERGPKVVQVLEGSRAAAAAEPSAKSSCWSARTKPTVGVLSSPLSSTALTNIPPVTPMTTAFNKSR